MPPIGAQQTESGVLPVTAPFTGGGTVTGPILLPNGTAAAPSLSFASEPGLGLYRIAAATLGIGGSGAMRFQFSGSNFYIGTDAGQFVFGASQDVALSRGAANRLDLATGDSLYLVSGGLGVGVAPPAAGAIQAAGAIVAGSNIDSGGRFLAPSSGYFGWSSRALLRSPADGIITINNAAETDFGRLQFGGTTSAFPALERSGVALRARLADNSAYTDFYAASVVGSVAMNAPIHGGASATGTLVTNDSQSIANAATVSLGGITSQGMVVVLNEGDDTTCMFVLMAQSIATRETADPDSVCSITAGTAVSVNVYWDAGDARYELQNNRATQTFKIIKLGQ